MHSSTAIKPISYLKAHAAEIVRDISKRRGAMIITRRGEAKVVVQDVRAYEDLQQSLIMLKLLAQSSESANKGRLRPLSDALRRVRKRVAQSARR